MVFFPLSDDNRRIWIRFHYVTAALIAACVLVLLLQMAAPGGVERIAFGLGLIPTVLWGNNELAPGIAMVPPALTPLTSLFVHGGWLHLLSNMAFLWIFGDNVEDAMGHRRFLAFFLLCGIVASLVHALSDPTSTVPMVGASGAISGILGAYFVLHPKVRVWVLVFSVIPLRLPTFVVIGGWIAIDAMNALLSDPETAIVAWWAHVGGFAAGALLIRFFKYEHVPLWDTSGGAWRRLDGLTLPSQRPDDDNERHHR